MMFDFPANLKKRIALNQNHYKGANTNDRDWLMVNALLKSLEQPKPDLESRKPDSELIWHYLWFVGFDPANNLDQIQRKAYSNLISLCTFIIGYPNLSKQQKEALFKYLEKMPKFTLDKLQNKAQTARLLDATKEVTRLSSLKQSPRLR